jgi:cell wall-associated NlpC family hydrolase
LGASRTNAAGQAKWCYDNGKMVGRSELQPGDLVFWQNLGCPGCSRWKEIHHVGIYVGNGKVMEASSSKGRVLVRNLWESANYPIWGFGRPYTQ